MTVHLLLLVHGMWGNPNHLSELARIIKETKEISEDDNELDVLVAKTNSDDSTYDGIDWGGERVAQEVSRGLAFRGACSDGNIRVGRRRGEKPRGTGQEGYQVLYHWI
jgi:hypothetical protein